MQEVVSLKRSQVVTTLISSSEDDNSDADTNTKLSYKRTRFTSPPSESSDDEDESIDEDDEFIDEETIDEDDEDEAEVQICWECGRDSYEVDGKFCQKCSRCFQCSPNDCTATKCNTN